MKARHVVTFIRYYLANIRGVVADAMSDALK